MSQVIWRNRWGSISSFSVGCCKECPLWFKRVLFKQHFVFDVYPQCWFLVMIFLFILGKSGNKNVKIKTFHLSQIIKNTKVGINVMYKCPLCFKTVLSKQHVVFDVLSLCSKVISYNLQSNFSDELYILQRLFLILPDAVESIHFVCLALM